MRARTKARRYATKTIHLIGKGWKVSKPYRTKAGAVALRLINNSTRITKKRLL